MIPLPKSVKSYNLMREASYANSVLQAFIQLECVQEWIKYLNNNQISDITVLQKVKFEKLENLYLSENEISDINVLSRVNLNLSKFYIEGNSFNPNNFYEIILSLQQKIQEFVYNKT